VNFKKNFIPILFIFMVYSINLMSSSNGAEGDEPGYLGFIMDQWAHSPHSLSMDTPEEKQKMNQPGCAHCHTAQGYWHEILGKKQSAAPYQNAVGITCIACHYINEPREKDAKLRAGNVEHACTGCHDILVQNDEKGFSSCPQGSILKGKGGMAIGDEVYFSGKHSQIEKNCVGCHMAKSPKGFIQRVGGHTFRVITKNQKDPVMNTNGCLDCHDTMNLELVRKSQDRVKQQLKALANLLPHRDVKSPKPWEEPKFPQDPSLSKIESLASYNYYTVWKDGTYGVHNPVYIKKLLAVSIQALKKEKASKSGRLYGNLQGGDQDKIILFQVFPEGAIGIFFMYLDFQAQGVF
jgi:hypothetical protein